MRQAKTVLRGTIILRACATAVAAWAAAGPAPAAEPTPPIAFETADVAVLANLDDDDRDGRPDADDEVVNGPADERDLVPLTVKVADQRVARLRVSSGDAPLRFFIRDGGGWRHAGLGAAEVMVTREPGGPATAALHAEASAWAGLPAAWNGVAQVAAEAFDATGKKLGSARATCRVAPVLLRPATARATEVFLATGRYDNGPFVAALREALEPLAVPLTIHPAADWREMWMQDTMEVATALIPGSRMHVVLAGLRGADSFPPTLLGPDTAVAAVGEPRRLEGGDAWADWYGNLEVSPPLAGHPQGRAIYGKNLRTGETFHPEVVRFLAAQGEQDPLWIDTSWLAIKHVDEIVAFLPGPDGRGVLLVPDPEEGLRLAGSVEPAADAVTTNRRIAEIIEDMLAGGTRPTRAGTHGTASEAQSPGLLSLFGWGRERVVRLPVAFRMPADGPGAEGGVAGAATLWSNPVNALFANGTVICGSCDMPEAVREVCRERLHTAGAAAVIFIDDAAYHRRSGNIHCATNATRE
jgi:protein-arginine deiminase